MWGLASIPVPGIPWLERFETNIDKLANGPYDLVFDGDSITDNWQTPGQPGPADLWKEKYGGLKALNLGIGGDQVQNLTWRVQNGSLAGQDPKLIVVMIGTNNLGNGASASNITSSIEKLLGEYEAHCPHAHILLLGVFPRGFTPTDPSRALVKGLNVILAGTNYGPRVTYLDFGSKFLEPDGSILPSTMPDGLHPAYAGYAIWAKAIQPVVDQYVTHASLTRWRSQAEVSAAPTISPARQVSLAWPQPVRPEKVTLESFPVPRIEWITSSKRTLTSSGAVPGLRPCL